MAVDGQGRLVRFILTGGQRNDITQAPALLAGFKPKCVLADKGHDSRQLVAQIHSLGAQLVIPPRSCQQPRACDKALYRTTQSHRTLLCQAQTVSPHRHSLRPQALPLPGFPLPRIDSLVGGVNVDSA